jgi:hypothetical protein
LNVSKATFFIGHEVWHSARFVFFNGRSVVWIKIMSLPEQGVRQRKNRTLNEIVQEFDAFNKVEDKVKDQKTVKNGICEFRLFCNLFIFLLLDSICCFLLIIVLCFGEIHEYWFNDNVLYRFGVDTNYDE